MILCYTSYLNGSSHVHIPDWVQIERECVFLSIFLMHNRHSHSFLQHGVSPLLTYVTLILNVSLLLKLCSKQDYRY